MKSVDCLLKNPDYQLRSPCSVSDLVLSPLYTAFSNSVLTAALRDQCIITISQKSNGFLAGPAGTLAPRTFIGLAGNGSH